MLDERIPIPICKRCGNEMDNLPISDTIHGQGEGSGPIKKFSAIAHRHHFQCQACIPPFVVLETPYPNLEGLWKTVRGQP